MRVIFASNNKHKLDEIMRFLGSAISCVALSDVWPSASLEETAHTFEGNAELKATQVFEKTGQPCLSDDSGLEVDVLEGRPGVFSARFAGVNASDADNRLLLLELMRNEHVRSARFRTVLCLKTKNGTEFFEGVLEGRISEVPAGENGFGYDSLFIPNGESRTLAEMSTEEKIAISHRSMAMKKLVSHLRKNPQSM